MCDFIEETAAQLLGVIALGIKIMKIDSRKRNEERSIL